MTADTITPLHELVKVVRKETAFALWRLQKAVETGTWSPWSGVFCHRADVSKHGVLYR